MLDPPGVCHPLRAVRLRDGAGRPREDRHLVWPGAAEVGDLLLHGLRERKEMSDALAVLLLLCSRGHITSVSIHELRERRPSVTGMTPRQSGGSLFMPHLQPQLVVLGLQDKQPLPLFKEIRVSVAESLLELPDLVSSLPSLPLQPVQLLTTQISAAAVSPGKGARSYALLPPSPLPPLLLQTSRETAHGILHWASHLLVNCT